MDCGGDGVEGCMKLGMEEKQMEEKEKEGRDLPIEGKNRVFTFSFVVIFNKNLQVIHQFCQICSSNSLDIMYRIEETLNCIIFFPVMYCQ